MIVPLVLLVTSLLQYNTDLGREGGAVLSLTTVWVDVTGYKSHTVSDNHREEE